MIMIALVHCISLHHFTIRCVQNSYINTSICRSQRQREGGLLSVTLQCVWMCGAPSEH